MTKKPNTTRRPHTLLVGSATFSILMLANTAFVTEKNKNGKAFIHFELTNLCFPKILPPPITATGKKLGYIKTEFNLIGGLSCKLIKNSEMSIAPKDTSHKIKSVTHKLQK